MNYWINRIIEWENKIISNMIRYASKEILRILILYNVVENIRVKVIFKDNNTSKLYNIRHVSYKDE